MLYISPGLAEMRACAITPAEPAPARAPILRIARTDSSRYGKSDRPSIAAPRPPNPGGRHRLGVDGLLPRPRVHARVGARGGPETGQACAEVRSDRCVCVQ